MQILFNTQVLSFHDSTRPTPRAQVTQVQSINFLTWVQLGLGLNFVLLASSTIAELWPWFAQVWSINEHPLTQLRIWPSWGVDWHAPIVDPEREVWSFQFCHFWRICRENWLVDTKFVLVRGVDVRQGKFELEFTISIHVTLVFENSNLNKLAIAVNWKQNVKNMKLKVLIIFGCF